MKKEELIKLPETKARAVALNLSYFYTAKPCVRGHLSARYTSSGNCIQCIAEKRGQPLILVKGNPRASQENLKLARAAMSLGFLNYRPANPCKKGHYLRCATTHNCLECAKANEKKNKNRKWQRIKKEYGLSKDDFFVLLQAQNESCAICCASINQNSCHVDHCHSKGHVRGLLCSKCNQGLGLFGDNKNNLFQAIKYLEKTQ